MCLCYRVGLEAYVVEVAKQHEVTKQPRSNMKLLSNHKVAKQL